MTKKFAFILAVLCAGLYALNNLAYLINKRNGKETGVATAVISLVLTVFEITGCVLLYTL